MTFNVNYRNSLNSLLGLISLHGHKVMQIKLYKYRTFKYDDLESKKRTEDIFLKNELYFSSPSKFNDPFDCFVHIDFSRTTKEEFWQHYYKTEKNPALTKKEIRENFENVYKLDSLQELYTNSIQTSFDSYGVYSLSSKNDNALMWSHYTDGHRGYCFELSEIEIKPQKVKYRKRNYKFNLFDKKNPLRLLLFTKPTYWKYEREWRCFCKKSGTINIQDKTIKSVILGSQMDDKNREKLLDIINKSNHYPEIFEAVINNNDYSLSIKKYEI